MTAREILKRCRTALAEIGAIERQIDRLMTTGAPRGNSSGKPRREKVKGGGGEYVVVASRTNNPEAARDQAVDGCEATLREKKRILEKLLGEMERMLEQLDDGNARAILRYYYAVGWSDEEIADELHMARQTVTNKRNAAVDYLDAVTKDC